MSVIILHTIDRLHDTPGACYMGFRSKLENINFVYSGSVHLVPHILILRSHNNMPRYKLPVHIRCFANNVTLKRQFLQYTKKIIICHSFILL